MKRVCAMLLALAVLWLGSGALSFPVKAEESSPLTFIVNSDKQSYRVSKCNKNVEGEIIVPAEYNGLPVTRIGLEAFAECEKITAIVLPEGITEIVHRAFKRCKALTQISIPASLEIVRTGAFANCSKLETIYYSGTQEQFAAIQVEYPDTTNQYWKNAAVVYSAAHTHSFGTPQVTVPPTLAGAGTQISACACGESREETIPPLTGKPYQCNVTLADDLRVNFVMEISPEILQDAQICVTLNGEATVYSAAELPTDEAGRPVFTVCLAAAQMTDAITVQVKNCDDVAPANAYTLEQYCKTVLSDPEKSSYHPIVNAILAYGAAAQTYFGYHTDALAGSGLTLTPGTALPETAADPACTGRVEGVAFYGASLLFRNRIALRFYFTGDLSGCTVQVGDKTYTPIEKNGLSYIEIADILPQNLDEAITVQVLSGSSTLTVTYSPLHYMVHMNAGDNTAIQDLVQALYNYHLAAKALSVA